MARAKATRKQAAVPPPVARDPEQRLIEAALTLAARQGWRRTGLAEIAAEAGLPLHEAYALHRSKAAILAAFARRVDAEMLAGTGPDEGESARERLFDVMMRRLDVLKPHKPAIAAILRESIGNPAAVLAVPGRLRSMRWMIEAAGISTAGPQGRLLVHLVLALYLSVLRVFLSDESEDLAATMAALDRGLRRGESFWRFAGRRSLRPLPSA